MQQFWSSIWFVAQVTGPIFLLVALGAWLRVIKVIDERFVEDSARVVFRVALPTLIFMAIAKTDPSELMRPAVLGCFVAATLASFGGVFWISGQFRMAAADRAAFVHGAFRSNYGIFGLAIGLNSFGQEALVVGSVILALLIPLYNILAVVSLTLPFHQTHALSWRDMLRQIVGNPLIIGVLAALPFSLLQIPLPLLATRTGDYLANLTLPLALIGIGGSLTLAGLREAGVKSTIAALIKTVALPLILTPVAIALGFVGVELGMLYLAFAAPTAAASFPMTRAMGGNGEMAGQIIVVSTLASAFTLGAGLFILRWGGWI
ncbi:AEC family transporter [Magnetofaba australis]|nr:AEC family transporter [Magnetofaba australis]